MNQQYTNHYSGEPLPHEVTYPVKYIHVNGAVSLCHNRHELIAAQDHDAKLFAAPFVVMTAVAVLFVALAHWLG